jgi:hypothetical protein
MHDRDEKQFMEVVSYSPTVQVRVAQVARDLAEKGSDVQVEFFTEFIRHLDEICRKNGGYAGMQLEFILGETKVRDLRLLHDYFSKDAI